MQDMDKTHDSTEKNVITHGPRYERNRRYYLKNTHASLRSTLLHNIKSNGRIPSEATVKKYSLKLEELIKNWRLYKEKVGCELSPIKKIKFEVLIVNLL
jgi:hypothetical protein